MDKIKFPYRSDGHLALLHVIHDTGAWAKHNLEVEYDYFIEAKDAHKLVADGEVEFVSGNHLTPYAARLKGDPWVYLGQTLNMNYHRLCVQPSSGINSVADLKGKGVNVVDVDRPAFRDALRKTSFYSDWKSKYGDQGWSTLEKYVGKLV